MNKIDAWNFLDGLETYLNIHIPSHKSLSVEISKIIQAARKAEGERHKAFPEGAFLNHYLIHHIHEFLATQSGMDKSKAREALLTESYRHFPQLASGSPVRSAQHPFRKTIGTNPRDVIKMWKGESKGAPVAQSCPDLAIRYPFQHKIVFEGKYFAKGGIGAAETELVRNIYQAFFYLGLPRLAKTKTHAAWDYDYACLLAFDATEPGNLQKAWHSLDERVRGGLWEGANIYVMVLRGNDNPTLFGKG